MRENPRPIIPGLTLYPYPLSQKTSKLHLTQSEHNPVPITPNYLNNIAIISFPPLTQLLSFNTHLGQGFEVYIVLIIIVNHKLLCFR